MHNLLHLQACNEHSPTERVAAKGEKAGRLALSVDFSLTISPLPHGLPRLHLIVVVMHNSGCIGGFLTALAPSLLLL